MKDGWHIIKGYDVYIEDGRIMRGTTGRGTTTYRAVYPYKYKREDGMRGWHNCSGAGVKVDTFRKGVNKGTYCMM